MADLYTPEEIALFGSSPEAIAAYRAARAIKTAAATTKVPGLLTGEGLSGLINPVGFVTSNFLKIAGPSQFDDDTMFGRPYPMPGSVMPPITGNETAPMAAQQDWSNAIAENPDILAAYTGGAGVDLGGGFILTNRGLFDSGSNRIISTPPLVPVNTPPPDAGGGGGGGSSGGGSEGDTGGDIGTLEPDPDLTGGTMPETGWMPAPGPDGKPDPTKPPIPETTTKTVDEWVPIIQDWIIRFPNVSDAEKQEAIEKYGVPAEAIKKAEEASQGGSGGTGGTGEGSGSGTGSGGSTGTVGGPVTPTAPATPSLPRPGPSPAPQPGPEVIPGTSTGPGTGTGTGGGSGSGMLGLSGTRTTEMVFPELYQPKLERFTVLGNLLSNQPWRYRA